MGRGLRRAAGFATSTILALVAVIALFATGALHDALFGGQLAASRLLHQRAAALAEIGLQDGLDRIGSMAVPEHHNYALRPLDSPVDSIGVRVLYLGTAPLPSGYSTSHFVAHQFEIQSTGHTARGIRMVQVQGAVRVMPVGPQAVDPTPALDPRSPDAPAGAGP